jgi:hypothetical protein
MAIRTFPMRSTSNKGMQLFSCVLKLIQGLIAILVTFFVIASSGSAIDILLNFIAINFVSEIDDRAFDLAKSGEFGPALQKKALEIEMIDLPDCTINNQAKAVRKHSIIKAILFGFLFLGMLILVYVQQSRNYWVTQEFRVQFQDGTGLKEYSGCYEVVEDTSFGTRRSYISLNRVQPSSFGYCSSSLQWILFKDDFFDYDPCDASRMELELARSPETLSFDIGSSFGERWVSSVGAPLAMYFFDSAEENHCNFRLGDGICDMVFNSLGYEYDGGDCCAHTCVGSACGKGGLSDAFGIVSDLSGDGFRHCKSPDTVYILIHFNNITSSRDPEELYFEDEWNSSNWGDEEAWLPC